MTAMTDKVCPLLKTANRTFAECVENQCAWYVDGACALSALAQSLHAAASNQQVTEPLQRNGCGDFDGALATKNQVTSNWISVEDRLPDHPNKVLIYNKSGKYGVGKYIERMDCFITTGQTVVTHWMELPDPPEEA